jgi:anti-sigma factor RsiW
MGVDEAKLAAYLDGELSEEECERVEEHLAGSPWLRDRLERLRQEADQVNQALDSLSPVKAVSRVFGREGDKRCKTQFKENE